MSSTKMSPAASSKRLRRPRGKSGQRNWLTLWRSLGPGALRKMPTASDDLLAFLAANTVPQTEEETQLLAAMLRGSDISACALHMARLSCRPSTDPSDGTMSWVLVAALRRHDVAILALFQALRDLARNHERQSEQAQLDVSNLEAVRTFRRASQSARRLMNEWSEEIRLSVLLASPQSWQKRFEPPRMDAATESAFSPPIPEDAGVLATPAGATLRVVSQIGFPDAEDEGVAATYRSLTEPLPLKGVAIASDTLRTTLSLEFPNMMEAIARIVDDLALRRWAGLSWTHIRPLLFLGPPGIGKSRFTRRLARLLGTGYAELDVAGSSDNRMLQGTARGWKGTQPCWPLLAMQQTGCANPILLIDEIDKAGASRSGGDVKNTLLAWLEPETARAWHDECLLAPADLSQVSWLLTANDLNPIPSALVSRLQIVHVGLPGTEAFDGILESILRDLAAGLCVDRGMLPAIDPDAREMLRQAFARGVGVRVVKRTVQNIVARSAKDPPRRH